MQEAQSEFPQLKAEFPDLVLHLIGPLQTNKVKDAAALFDVLNLGSHTPGGCSGGGARQKRQVPRSFFMQVNTGEEPQKAGVLPAETEALIAYARKLELPLVGLMCIPPVEDDVAPHFAFLAKLAKENGLGQLSMGMSGDFEMAIRFGATHVRVGSAIFGERAKISQ